MESGKEAVDYFEMMKRLNYIKSHGSFKYHDLDYSKFFYYIIKTVIVIGFDTMTKKRIENKRNDIKFKENLVTSYENEVKEIKSKIELIQDIKSQVEMGKTTGERRQMANKDNECKEKENDQKLIETVIFYIILFFYYRCDSI